MHINCLNNQSNIQKDVVIITAPLTDTAIPLMAPAALKPIVEHAGLTCLAVDLNAEIYKLVREHPLQNDLVRFFFEDYTTEETEIWLQDLFYSITQQILLYKPKIVCISVFSYVCQIATKWLSYYIKKLAPDVEIYIGGAGCLNTFTGPSKFVDELLESGLVNYHVRGDGEHSLYELLTGNNKFPGINSLNWQEMTNEELAKIPMPDYDDYDFSVYEKRVLPLLGSRGCVRQCTFCDYIANWKKFQWRTADDIFNEIVEQYQRYGLTNFKFQDSLTNGNQKEFRRLCELLAEHNNVSTVNFKWSGYYIFREWSNTSLRDWELIYQSGAENLMVGIENLNEDIRFAIGKKFSDEAIDLHIEQAHKYGIYLQLLNIVGYVNETEEHIAYIKQWLVDHVKYKSMLYLQWGGTLGIFPNTYLEQNKEQLGIIMIGTQPQSWINPVVNSTPELRARWANELNEYSRQLGYTVADNIDNHYLLETLINA
jgi:radical SAM superfamily enzyme YgiQ (UPF0313 family)